MIRVLLMTTCFVACTGALIWTLGGSSEQTVMPDQVSRGTPDLMNLQPAMSPVVQPVAQRAPEAQVAPEPIVAPVSKAPQDETTRAIEAMGYGILEELKRPVQQAAPAPQRTASLGRVPEPVSSPAPQSAARTYTVQPGDSLPGIAFRFYGTTAAYLQILDANTDVVRAPADLRAGMVLTIPD